MPPHNIGDPDVNTIRLFTLSGFLAAVMSLLTDVADERGGGFLTRLARAILNGAFALGVAALLLRWVELTPTEIVVLSSVLGSLGREFTAALLLRWARRWQRGP